MDAPSAGQRSVVCGLWSVVRRPRLVVSGQLSAVSGFTLLELIVALTIFGLMAGIMFSSFRMGLSSYEKSQDRLDVEARRRVLQDQIKRQIGSLFPVRPSASFLELQELNDQGEQQQARLFAQVPLFSGTSDSMTFTTVAPLMLHENPGLTIVHYERAQDEQGNYYLGATEARYLGLTSFMSMLDSSPEPPFPLIENIVDLRFQYYGYDPQSESYQWFDSWFGEEVLAVPQAIRIDYDENHILVPINASFSGGQLRQAMQRFTQGR